jgi:DNA-directed RNA polymerase specialized sigma24 family protein
MLDEGLRAAILAMHRKGLGVRTIARAMKLSRGAVRGVVRRARREGRAVRRGHP